MIEFEESLRDGVLEVAKMMALSARTAPKARGIDNIEVKILNTREELELLASKMEELSKEFGDFFLRDAQNVRNSVAVVLIGGKIMDLGLKNPGSWGINASVVCSLVNLGIAVGSAVKTASLHNVDNRVMFTAGVAAQELGLIKADYVFGIPLSATPKNIYFDRRWPPTK
ncbi:MAG: DUF2148 domain-containing protein [Desulfurococcaceae archaeon]|nr:DUF2148 domain-containing protein [Desulfurococcaceae archaeon]